MFFDAKPIYEMPEGIQTRWACAENVTGEKGGAAKSFGGRKGSAAFELNAGEKKLLAEEKNSSGTIRRMWVTIDDRSTEMLRGLKFEIYWDGSDIPAVCAPLGDFFGQGLGRMSAFESALFTNPEGRSLNCYIPMPFKKGMKVYITNDTKKHLQMFFYEIDYTIGDKHGNDILYFHAHWRRENPTTIQKDYEFLPKITGKGRFLGVNVGVIADTDRYFKTWWGEGECKIYLDGDKEFPTLSGTGTEDYIGTGWGQGQYSNMYQGCHLADEENYQYAFYRYHILDPVYFYQEIKVTMQQIGCMDQELRKKLLEAGRILVNGPERKIIDLSKDSGPIFERQDDWSSCAYFYFHKPSNELPVLPDLNSRVSGLLNK